ncbi:hypothetical protein RUND412_003676 [Rhizina undulata]
MAHLWSLLSSSCVWIGVLFLWAGTLGSVAEDVDYIQAFDLLPVDGSGYEGQVALMLGYPPQNVTVLASFYSELDVSVQVPSGAICDELDDDSDSWNAIELPAEGDVVNVAGGSGSTAGIQVVKWEASSGVRTLNITLRKGNESAAENVSLIETGITNDGEYSWNVTRTVLLEGLKEDSDYSLMLWTSSPPRRSISGYFSLGNGSSVSSSSSRKSLLAANSTTDSCLDYLSSNGGYYNSTADEDFELGDSATSVSDSNISYYIDTLGGGATTMSLDSGSSFTNVSVSILSQASLGIGVIALSTLQQKQNPTDPQKNIVAIDIGTRNRTGSIVLGGYDSTLVNSSQSFVLPKNTTAPAQFEVYSMGTVYLGENATNVTISSPFDATSPHTFLEYELLGIKLPPATLDYLLPLIGNPTYDEDLDGYVYENDDAIESNYSLLFILGNGTNFVEISLQAEDLLEQESATDNPLTSHNETGRTFLRLSNSTGDVYLGRAFLKYIYLVDSPADGIGKFHVNAIPALRTEVKLLVSDTTSIFESMDVASGGDDQDHGSSSGVRVGRIVGGIVGGVMVIIGGSIILLLVLRRRRRRGQARSAGKDVTVDLEGDTDAGERASSDRGYASNNTPDKELVTSTSLPLPRPPSPPPPPPPPPSPSLEHTYFNGHYKQFETASLRPLPPTPPTSSPPTRSQSLSGLQHRPAYNQETSSLQRTATLGKVIGRNQISTVDATSRPSNPIRRAKTVSHARTASVGRVVTPLALEFEKGVLVRRGSGSERGSRGSGKSKLSELRDVAKKDTKEERPMSESGSVFGLEAVKAEGGCVSGAAADQGAFLELGDGR